MQQNGYSKLMKSKRDDEQMRKSHSQSSIFCSPSLSYRHNTISRSFSTRVVLLPAVLEVCHLIKSTLLVQALIFLYLAGICSCFWTDIGNRMCENLLIVFSHKSYREAQERSCSPRCKVFFEKSLGSERALNTLGTSNYYTDFLGFGTWICFAFLQHTSPCAHCFFLSSTSQTDILFQYKSKHLNRKLSEVVRDYVPLKMTGSLAPFISFIWGFLNPLPQSFVRNKIYMELLDINT